MNEFKPELHIRMSLSPNYTLEIRISERFCLKGDEKLFELQKVSYYRGSNSRKCFTRVYKGKLTVTEIFFELQKDSNNRSWNQRESTVVLIEQGRYSAIFMIFRSSSRLSNLNNGISQKIIISRISKIPTVGQTSLMYAPYQLSISICLTLVRY